jgi:ketosteroid isomerase-like protein
MTARSSFLSFAHLGLLVVCACSPADERAETGNATHATADSVTTEMLIEADRDFATATAERGIEGWVSNFASNGAMIIAGRGVVQGHAAIRDIMGPFLADSNPRLLWEPIRAEIGESGDLGYTISSRREARDSANTLLGTGTYLTIWRRQADGTWKVEVDIGTYTPVTPTP